MKKFFKDISYIPAVIFFLIICYFNQEAKNEIRLYKNSLLKLNQKIEDIDSRLTDFEDLKVPHLRLADQNKEGS